MHRDGLDTGRRVECSQRGKAAKRGNADRGARRVHAGMRRIQRAQEGGEVQRVLESDWKLRKLPFQGSGREQAYQHISDIAPPLALALRSPNHVFDLFIQFSRLQHSFQL